MYMPKAKQELLTMSPQELLKLFVKEVGVLINARISTSETNMKAEIKASESRLRAEINGSEERVKSELRKEIKESAKNVKTDIRHDIKTSEERVKAEIYNQRIKDLEERVEKLERQKNNHASKS